MQRKQVEMHSVKWRVLVVIGLLSRRKKNQNKDKPGGESYREKNQMDKENHEARFVKPEEIITRLNQRGASYHIAFLLDS